MHAIQTSRSSSSSSRRELQEVPATNDISIGKSSIHALYQNLISEHSVCSLWWWTPNKTKPSWKLFLISVFVSKKPNPWCQARSQLFQSQDLGLDLENIVERLEPSVNQKNVFVVFFFLPPFCFHSNFKWHFFHDTFINYLFWWSKVLQTNQIPIYSPPLLLY